MVLFGFDIKLAGHHFVKLIEQSGRVFTRVVKRERSAGGGGDVEKLHHRLRAMVAGADGDALLVEYRADVVRMNALDSERQNARLVRGGADDLHAGNVCETRSRVFEKLVLISGRDFEIYRVYVIDRRAKADAGGDGRSSRFKLFGNGSEGSFLK